MTAYYRLGELLSSMSEYRQAEKVYRRIVLMDPDDAVAQAKATAMASLKEQKSETEGQAKPAGVQERVTIEQRLLHPFPPDHTH